jgi:triacylglycerol lipase
MSDAAPAAALCLHGFLRTGLSMLPMGRHLQAQGYARVPCPTVVYQAAPLARHAATMSERARRLAAEQGVPRVDLVTHSMGGLLARAMLAQGAPIRRIVMLAPPNRGAWMAEQARRLLPLHLLGWDPLQPLLPGAPGALPQGAADVEIGILTGGRGDDRGMWPFVPGDNDGRVRVEEAALEGARELRVLPYGHATIMLRAEVMRLVTGFLKEGRFPDPA